MRAPLRRFLRAPPRRFWPSTMTEYIDIGAKVAAASAAVLAYLSYHDAQQAQRVARVQDFIERATKPPIADARETITAALLQQQPALEDLRKERLSPETATSAQQQLVLFLVYDSRGGQGLVAEVDRLVAFYDTLAICSRELLCDSRVAKAYFFSDAQRFIENFRPYIAERRKTAPNYAIEAERFAST